MGNERLSWDFEFQWTRLDYLNFDLLRLSFMNHAPDDDFVGARGFSLIVLGVGVSASWYGA